MSASVSFRPRTRDNTSKVNMSFITPVHPGINLDANDGPQTNAVAIIFIVMSFMTLVLRFFSRLTTHVSIDLDDQLIVVAAVGLNENRSSLYTRR